jgi:dephospho-CoA kinase
MAAMGTRVIGLTGGIASGKTTVGRMLRELGAPVVDADLIARQVVEPGQPAYADIVREFGREVVLPDGALDRKRLGEIVFGDQARRRILEAITHPRIAMAAQAETAGHAAAGQPVVIYEAALIVENRLHEALGGLIVVKATPEQQVERAMKRDGISEEHARARVASQLPLARKLEVATHVVDNTGTLDETRAQVERLWRELQGEGTERT